MRILIVKLSSMGDIIQALPAVTDACAAIADLQIDWAVDESFNEIPLWHPGVRKTIVSAHRRWRQNRSASTVAELRQYHRSLREQEYDLVIDAQSNLKSALVTRFARGEKHGLDKHSVREFGAQLAYQTQHSIDKNQLAINRWRQLLSQALAYPLPSSAPDFRLRDSHFDLDPALRPTSNYTFFIHNASWASKLWPTDQWRELIKMAGRENKNVLLPWGTLEEKFEAERISKDHDNAFVLPKLTLSELAALLKGSDGAICMDTGLAHLAAAIGVRTLTLYGPTDAALIGATGANIVHLTPAKQFTCAPCYKRTCHFQGNLSANAVCLQDMTPQSVWNTFTAQ